MKEKKISQKYKYLFPVMVFVLFLFCVVPQVYARNVFKDMWRGIKRGTNFVVNLPDKATRWMGPVLGPIAADILTYNIGKNPRIGHIFNNARRVNQTINSIDDQKKYLSQVKTNLRDQAGQLRTQANEIRNLKNELGQQLISREITLDEYQDKVVALSDIADSYERVADKFSQRADSIKPENVIKMVARNAWRETIRQIKNEINFEVKNELNRFVNPNIINTLVGNDDLSFDQILDVLISGDISSIIGQNKDVDINQLRERVRGGIKDILKNNKDALKNNWKNEINKIIKQELEKLEKEKKNLPDKDKIIEQNDTDEQKPSQDSRCPSGYEYCPSCGVECRQINCYDTPNAHWDYVGRCSCGSAGSINENPKDPNKPCVYSQSHKLCPGCVYECVHYDEECPLEGIE